MPEGLGVRAPRWAGTRRASSPKSPSTSGSSRAATPKSWGTSSSARKAPTGPMKLRAGPAAPALKNGAGSWGLKVARLIRSISARAKAESPRNSAPRVDLGPGAVAHAAQTSMTTGITIGRRCVRLLEEAPQLHADALAGERAVEALLARARLERRLEQPCRPRPAARACSLASTKPRVTISGATRAARSAGRARRRAPRCPRRRGAAGRAPPRRPPRGRCPGRAGCARRRPAPPCGRPPGRARARRRPRPRSTRSAGKPGAHGQARVLGEHAVLAVDGHQVARPHAAAAARAGRPGCRGPRRGRGRCRGAPRRSRGGTGC